MKHSSDGNSEQPTVPSGQDGQPREEDIRELAYRLYQECGCATGHDLQHWLEAEDHLQKQGDGAH